MNRLSIILIALTASLSCTKIPIVSKGDSWILKIDTAEVSTNEFEYMLTKNQPDSLFLREDINEYLELYTNFKLKVRQARSEGYDTIPELRKEFEGYKSELLKPYMNLSGMDDSLVAEAYRRSLFEVRASHILISFNDRTESEALRKILEIGNLVKQGQDFDSLAMRYSEDPSVKINKGDLGYFSAFRMVLPFELAAYSTTVGSVSNPVKTQFGFHIIKVTDRRPAREQLKLAHILVRGQDDEASTEKINRIYDLLQQGETWDKLCAQFSEDLNSRSKGGVLPWISSGQTAPEFENAAYALDSGEFSKPTKTPYGWHLIKLIDRKKPGNLESQKAIIEQKLRRNNTEQLDEMEILLMLKDRYGFQQNDSAVYSMLAGKQFLDTTTLFRFDGQQIYIKSYQNFLSSAQKENTISSYRSFVSQTLRRREEMRILTEHPEVSFLIREYDEGLLLFEVMDDKVWTKAVEDTIGLQSYYESNLNEYWQDSSFRVVTLSPEIEDLTLRKSKAEELSQVNLNADSLQAFASQNNLIFEEVILESGDPRIASLPRMQNLHFVNTPGRFAVVILERMGGKQQDLQNIKGQVITDFQNYLDMKWIEELRSRARVEVNEAELKKIYSRYEK